MRSCGYAGRVEAMFFQHWPACRLVVLPLLGVIQTALPHIVLFIDNATRRWHDDDDDVERVRTPRRTGPSGLMASLDEQISDEREFSESLEAARLGDLPYKATWDGDTTSNHAGLSSASNIFASPLGGRRYSTGTSDAVGSASFFKHCKQPGRQCS